MYGYLPGPGRLTRDDWYPATYTHPKHGDIKVMCTNRMTRQDTATPPYTSYTWCRVSQRKNLPPDTKYVTGAAFFAPDKSLSERN